MSRDLNDTLVFIKVVECGSFTRAAERLGVPKATVSRRVQELETRLDTRLIQRTTRKLGLTEAGTIYFEHCQRIALSLDEAESAVHQLQSGPRGWLRVTTSYALGMAFIGPLLIEFRRRYPDVRVELILDSTYRDLIEEEIDLALRFGPLPESTLVARKLASFQPQIYATPGYLVQHGEPLAPEDLEHHRSLANSITTRRSGGRFAWSLTDGVRHEDFAISPIMVCNDPLSLKPMLMAGEGLMHCSDVLMREELETGLVRRVLSAWAGPAVDLNAVFPHGRALSPKVRVFLDFLIERLRFKRPRVATVASSSGGVAA